jgi:long-chain acyl-CoA synthetase
MSNGTNDKLALHPTTSHPLADPTDASTPLDVTRVVDGARLMILGGTGFLGKLFWVLLLTRYPNVGKIFLLVRSSAEKTSEERFWTTVATNKCLDPLRAQHGDGFEAFLREKIVPLDGDLGKKTAGIDPAIVAELRGTIDAVVNVAGVVDFNPPLDEALDANAFGAQNLLSLARALGDVPVFHTSTCYVAGRRKGPIYEVDPTEYPFPRADQLGRELWDPDREISDCLDLIAQANHRCDDAFRQSDFAEKAEKNLLQRGEPTEGKSFEEELSRVRRKYVADRLVEAGRERAVHWGWPNIYTYTKSIGEQVIARSGLPFTIVRPACCESCIEFPEPGWNEGISTSVPIIFMSLKGQLTIPGRHVLLDFIPADMVCAGMILSLAELLEGTQKAVYQYGGSDVNPATAARLGELIGLYKRKYYQRRGKGNPIVNFIQAHLEPMIVGSKYFSTFATPQTAKITRWLASATRGTPLKGLSKPLSSFSSQEARIAEIMLLFEPFTHEQNGPFSCANTRAAHARLSAEDKAKLKWEPEKIDFMDWMMNVHMPGVERHILPEMDKKMVREPKALRAHETLVSLLHQMAERHDLTLAFQQLEEDGLSRVTFRDVRDRSGAMAARLSKLGVKKGDRVVLSASNHPDWAIAYFGILCAGATAVPVDPALDAEAFWNVVDQSGARLAVMDQKAKDARQKAAESGQRLPPGALLDVHDITAADASLCAPDVTVLPADIASLIYTSGTTGTPKGVQLTHGNFASLIAALAPIFPLGANDRVLSVLPLHHTFEFTCGLLLPFSRGARVAYLDELNGDRITRALQLGRATAMVGVPALWQLLERRILARVKEKGPIAEAAFNWSAELNRFLGKQLGFDLGKQLFAPVHAQLGGSVKYLISGGAALPKETHKLFSGLGLHLTEGYGLTEAAPVLTVSKPSPKSPPGQVGKAIPGVQVKIASPDEQGVGEVVAKGPNVMAGYTDVAATAEVIDADGWLHTGDLGKLDRQGRLVIVGRVKDVIVTASGENVYPDDVEKRLGKVDRIEELAIVGVESKSGGERVACLALPEKDESISRAERSERAMKALRNAIGKLPYVSQPAIVHLYEAPLPRTATRKVKRNEVKAILERIIASLERPEGADTGASPVRVAIAGVTGKPLASIHATSTLQDDLGFDSLTLTELLVAIEAKYGAVDPAALTACRTVSEVEALLEGRSARAESRTKTIEGRGASRKRDEAPLKLPPAVQALGKSVLGKLQMAFYGDMMKPRVSGRAFIPYNRNTIVVSNHASHLDMGFVKYALGSYGNDLVSLAAQDYFFEGKSLTRAYFENFTNLVALDRRAVRQSLRQSGQVLDAGKTALIFPEGTRSPDGEIHEFKAMVGVLALTHKVDILPLWLGGTREAMPKGSLMIPRSRDIQARIGPPLTYADMKRLTAGMTSSDSAREVARLAHAAVLALRDGEVLDFTTLAPNDKPVAKRPHPLVRLFEELEKKFRPGEVSKPISYYFTLGGDAMAKWTVKVDPSSCEIKLGKPESGTADCVLKTSAEIFTKIVREAYTPGPAEFLSGAVKSNDVELLQTFQKVFQLA